ncbi:MAG: DUF6034 family protein [Clostridia bacterium]|nr:DUF6034 family protein [Clostridia bacterium]
MKRAWIIALVAILLLTGCQPTPEEDIVVNKGEGKLEEIISATAAPTLDAVLDVITVREKIGAPERVELEFSEDILGGVLNIVVDATVYIPEISAVPVAHVQLGGNQQERAQLLLDKLFSGQTLYKYDYVQLKRAWMQEIEYNTLWLESLESQPYGNGHDYDEIRWEIENNIAYLYDWFNSAPESVELVPWDSDVSAERVLVMNENFDKITLTETGIGFRKGDVSRNFISGETMRQPQSESEQAAAQKALDFINGLEMGEFELGGIVAYDESIRRKLSSKDGFDGGFYFTILLPIHYGMPSYDYSTYNGSTTGYQAAVGSYTRTDPQESVYMTVYKGEVSYMDWNSPLYITEVLNEDVELLSFDEIMEIFQRQVPMNIYFDEGAEGASDTLIVTVIRLSYMRVKQIDSDEYYLLPVWDFLGYGAEATTEWEREWYNGQSFLTINAVDGSIVNRNLGF